MPKGVGYGKSARKRRAVKARRRGRSVVKKKEAEQSAQARKRKKVKKSVGQVGGVTYRARGFRMPVQKKGK